MDCVTVIRPFILINQFKKKSVQETNKYLPLLLRTCSAANHSLNARHIHSICTAVKL